jgi:hypothetical protein
VSLRNVANSISRIPSLVDRDQSTTITLGLAWDDVLGHCIVLNNDLIISTYVLRFRKDRVEITSHFHLFINALLFKYMKSLFLIS